MKKSLLLVGLAALLSFPLITSAEADKIITLAPGWNVVSTPAILSSIEFSNQGEGISFSKLSNGAWISVPATVENIKPLEGFMVYSSNADDVTMSLTYKKDVSPTDAVLQKNLNYGWDLLGIVTTTSPFKNIGEPAVMSLDFTDNGTTNYLNKVNDNYAFDSTSSNIVTPQLGEAYGIFINQQNAVYGGANGGGTSGGGNTGGGETDCDDPLVVLACNHDSDACPSECRGEVTVNYTNSTNQNVIVGGVSNLDQINIVNLFGKAVSEITLKQYGYASIDNIESVWLEDLQGNKITNPKAVNTQGTVTLQILNGVTINADFGIRVVVETNNTLVAGQNMLGFKVTNVVADNENYSFNDNESPYLYSAITYAASSVRIIPRGADSIYNRVAGNYYEISQFRITTQSNTLLKGFELTNSGNLLLTNNNSDIIVELSNGEVTSLSTSISNGKLIVTFDDVEIPGNSSIIVTVKAKLIDFDQQGKSLQYSVANASDIRAEEETTGARVAVIIDEGTWPTHTFEGGKIQFSNTNLGNVDARQGATDVEIGRGSITITEPVTLSFSITTQNLGINGLSFEVGGYLYDATSSVQGDNIVFTFTNIKIPQSSTVKFYADIDRDATVGNSMTFTNLSHSTVTAKYGDTNIAVNSDNILGTIVLSKLTVQQAKATLANNLTKATEFYQGQSERKVVFDGTYTAKGEIFLNEVLYTGTKGSDGNNITFYLFIDGEEVASTNGLRDDSFNSIRVNGESVPVKVEAEIDATTVINYSDFSLILQGEDWNGNPAGIASRGMVTIKVVEAPQLTISNSATQNTVLLKAANTSIANFIVKASNTNGTVDFQELTLSGNIDGTPLAPNNLTVRVNDVEVDATTPTSLTYNINENVDSEGVEIEVILRTETKGNVILAVTSINDMAQNKTYTKRFEDALVYVSEQRDLGGTTRFTLGVEKSDSTIEVSNFKVYVDENGESVGSYAGIISDGDTIEVLGEHNYAQMITKIVYDVTEGSETETVEILKSVYPDFFKIGDTYVRIFKVD